jgi:hypothetical protein
MKRVILALLSVLAFGVSTAPAAFATLPVHQRWDWAEVDLTFHHACAFPVDVQIRYRGQLTTFMDADGDPVRAIGTGPVFNTVTNLDTGASLTFTASGPVFLGADLNLIRGSGGWLFIGDWIFFVTGHIEFSGPYGVIQSVRGHTTDLCERLS